MSAPFLVRPRFCTVQVFQSDDWRVVSGVNKGDKLGPVEDLVLEDVYRLSPWAVGRALKLERNGSNSFRVCPQGTTTQFHATIQFGGVLIFMTFEGKLLETIVLIEDETGCGIGQTYVYPLAPVQPEENYCLIGLELSGQDAAFAKMAHASV